MTIVSIDPRISYKISDGESDRFADGFLRAPAGFPDFRAVEKNEGIVPHPSPLPAGIVNRGARLQLIADFLDGIVHLDIFIGPQIIDFSSRGGRLPDPG